MAYTHGYHESVLRSHRSRTAQNSAAHLLPLLNAEDRLLDVGAGAGTITVDLANAVAEVTATEVSAEALDLTRATVADRGATNIAFEVADVHSLPFDDGTFDVVHAHQVLQHVANPVQALREMARVTRSGGIVAVRDSDYGGFRWWPELPQLDRWLELYRSVAVRNGGDPDAGRRLLSRAHESGITDVVASSSTWCYATPDARVGWGHMWADRIVDSAIAEQIVRWGLATPADLAEVSAGWREWAASDDGWFSLLHGEIVCRVA